MAPFWNVFDRRAKGHFPESVDQNTISETQESIEKKLRKNDRKAIKHTFPELDQLMKDCLEKAKEGQHSHHSNKDFSKRVGKGATEFLVCCQSYLKAYAGVVQAVETVDPGYGRAAYSALSVFFVVAINKNETEREIDDMLQTLSAQYTQIKLLEPVYKKESLDPCVTRVYTLGIQFLQDAARYYGFKSYRRFWHILAKPPNIDLQDRVLSIKNAISDLANQRGVQDSIRLGAIDMRVNVLVENQLQELRQLLETVDEDLFARLGEYENALETFERIKRLEPFDFNNKFLSDEAFGRWNTETNSSFLVIRGKTVAPYNTLLSWVSPAATGFIRQHEDLSPCASSHTPSSGSQRDECLLFYCCQDAKADLEDPAMPVLPSTVVSGLIYQLLRTTKAKAILNDSNQFRQLKLDIQKSGSKANNDDHRARLFQLYDIFRTLLDRLSFDKVYLVLDRPDCMRGHDTALGLLLKLVQTFPRGLKILVVGPKISPEFLDDSREKQSFLELVFDQDS